jgi:FkbM family methyltransferase
LWRNEVGEPQERFAQFLLRFGSPLAGLRQVPVLGKCVSWAGAKLVPRNSLTWVQVQNGAAKGLWLRLNPRTGQAYFEGHGEAQVQAALEKHLKPGMTFYDVGANIGFFTLIAARLVGESGHVVAFEADPEIAGRLRGHLARNKFGWANVEERAVWSATGVLRFARTDPNSSPDRGLGHVVADSSAQTIQVPGVSLDDFALTHRPADFVKCDVEGAEVEVFRGAARLLRERRPVIVCEMHSDKNQRALIESFASLGYACTNCGSNHVLAIPQ